MERRDSRKETQINTAKPHLHSPVSGLQVLLKRGVVRQEAGSFPSICSILMNFPAIAPTWSPQEPGIHCHQGQVMLFFME
jgi:hypothetical protein